jgi:hypothetical protein
MQDYDIRILNFDGTLSLQTRCSHLNSLAAISAARRLAGNRPYEVWSDDYCLYSSLGPAPITQPPDRPAA